MHRAVQPLLVQRVQLDGITVEEDARTAHERDVVKVDDVVATRGEQLSKRPSLQHRTPGRLGQERRQHTERAPQRVNRDVRVVRHRDGHVRPRCKRIEAVDAVYDVDEVPLPGKRVREPIHVACIAAKMIGRVEGRDMRDPDLLSHGLASLLGKQGCHQLGRTHPT